MNFRNDVLEGTDIDEYVRRMYRNAFKHGINLNFISYTSCVTGETCVMTDLTKRPIETLTQMIGAVESYIHDNPDAWAEFVKNTKEGDE